MALTTDPVSSRPPATLNALFGTQLAQEDVRPQQQSPDQRHFLVLHGDGLGNQQRFGKPHYYLGGLQGDYRANRARTLTTLKFFRDAPQGRTPVPARVLRHNLEPPPLLLENIALPKSKSIDKIIQPLLAPMNQIHHPGERAMLRQFGKILASHEQLIPHRLFNPPMQPP